VVLAVPPFFPDFIGTALETINGVNRRALRFQHWSGRFRRAAPGRVRGPSATGIPPVSGSL